MTDPGDDPHDLARFLQAQRGAYGTALAELQAGEKPSHWMWFVFPQMAGLGHSTMARRYAIRSLGEARAFLDHPVLGERLHGATLAVLEHRTRSLRRIFGYPDDRKFVSSMTLFAHAADDDAQPCERALHLFHGGKFDQRTVELLGA